MKTALALVPTGLDQFYFKDKEHISDVYYVADLGKVLDELNLTSQFTELARQVTKDDFQGDNPKPGRPAQATFFTAGCEFNKPATHAIQHPDAIFLEVEYDHTNTVQITAPMDEAVRLAHTYAQHTGGIITALRLVTRFPEFINGAWEPQ
jgi:hypothetical protein